MTEDMEMKRWRLIAMRLIQNRKEAMARHLERAFLALTEKIKHFQK